MEDGGKEMTTRTFTVDLDDDLSAGLDAALAAETPPRSPELFVKQSIYTYVDLSQRTALSDTRSEELRTYTTTWQAETSTLLDQIDSTLGGFPLS